MPGGPGHLEPSGHLSRAQYGAKQALAPNLQLDDCIAGGTHTRYLRKHYPTGAAHQRSAQCLAETALARQANPEILGRFRMTPCQSSGSGSSATTGPSSLEITSSLPAEFVAVTWTLMRASTSSSVSTCVVPVAPAIAVPSRSQARANVAAGVPPAVPFVTVRVSPTVGVPDRTGSTVKLGAIPATGPTPFDVAVSVPPEFVAVTTQVMFCPTSAATKVYVVPVADAIFVAPRRHCRVNEGEGLPDRKSTRLNSSHVAT